MWNIFDQRSLAGRETLPSQSLFGRDPGWWNQPWSNHRSSSVTEIDHDEKINHSSRTLQIGFEIWICRFFFTIWKFVTNRTLVRLKVCISILTLFCETRVTNQGMKLFSVKVGSNPPEDHFHLLTLHYLRSFRNNFLAITELPTSSLLFSQISQRDFWFFKDNFYCLTFRCFYFAKRSEPTSVCRFKSQPY